MSGIGTDKKPSSSKVGTLRVLPFVLLMAVSTLAQSPRYGVGRTPSAEEIRAWDISIGPTGEELPPGRGTAKEGAQLYRAKGGAGCHGATGIGSMSPMLKSKAGPDVERLPLLAQLAGDSPSLEPLQPPQPAGNLVPSDRLLVRRRRSQSRCAISNSRVSCRTHRRWIGQLPADLSLSASANHRRSAVRSLATM